MTRLLSPANPNLGDAPAWYDDVSHVWLPYTQMKTTAAPLPVASTRGSRITLSDGRELIDGIASWWTACHGYNHPHIRAVLTEQLATMPHVMLGGLVHEPALRLARRLADITPGNLERVFFSESGSVSVEVAMKIAIQYQRQRGHTGRTRFVSFLGGYHGDTLGTMAVADPEEGMHALFNGVLREEVVVALPRTPDEMHAFSSALLRDRDSIAAVLIEPRVQGAGGMLFHDPEVLRGVRKACDEADVLMIADEIFVGFGRLGALFACESADVTPDIMTLSKALTGGTLPLAATVVAGDVFAAFWSERTQDALMHGPTYMGNALACAAANASLDLFEQEPRVEQARAMQAILELGLAPLRRVAGVRDVRCLGAIGVVQLDEPGDLEKLKADFIRQGVWVRPFRDIVYVTPALNIDAGDLDALLEAVRRGVAEHLK